MPVSLYHSLDALPAEDINILSYKVQGDIFRSIEWFQCLSKYAPAEDALEKIYVFTKDDDQTQKCYLFCYLDKKRRKLLSMSNFYTMEFAPIFSHSVNDKKGLLDEFVKYIVTEKPSSIGLDFRLLLEDREGTNKLCESLTAQRFLVNKYFQYENYFVNTKNIGFDDYYNSRPSRARNTIKRKSKKLQRQKETRIEIFSNFDRNVVNDYMSVYARSWKNEEKYPNFIPELCRVASRLGLLRLGILFVDNVPAASQIWLLSGRKAIIYKLAYDEAFKEFSVGSILTKEIVKYVLENDKVEEIDYGVGSEPYKKDWMDSTRTLIGIEAFNTRTLVGRARALRWSLSRLFKKFLGGSSHRPAA